MDDGNIDIGDDDNDIERSKITKNSFEFLRDEGSGDDRIRNFVRKNFFKRLVLNRFIKVRLCATCTKNND